MRIRDTILDIRKKRHQRANPLPILLFSLELFLVLWWSILTRGSTWICSRQRQLMQLLRGDERVCESDVHVCVCVYAKARGIVGGKDRKGGG